MTYNEARKIAYKDYDPDKIKNRMYEIFNSNSITNKCLRKYCEILEKYSPDIEAELDKLGLDKHIIIENPGFVTPGTIDIYSNENDYIEVSKDCGLIVAKFNGKEKVFKSTEEIGDDWREFLEWIKSEING